MFTKPLNVVPICTPLIGVISERDTYNHYTVYTNRAIHVISFIVVTAMSHFSSFYAVANWLWNAPAALDTIYIDVIRSSDRSSSDDSRLVTPPDRYIVAALYAFTKSRNRRKYSPRVISSAISSSWGQRSRSRALDLIFMKLRLQAW